ncbi:MAG: septum formation inhibitor Maf [Acidobacteria bacterium]|nr:septum formation inhibitor Maf [Acidobacteriota bacterium]MBA3884723.1 septum formation inhibitor Maf [Acidobacteriota bacterium]
MLVLASASPRRAELLTSAGFSFEVAAADVDETPHSGELPQAYTLRVARAKAAAVFSRCRKSGTQVLAADTVVVVDGQILGKPAGAVDAERMLKILSGKAHDVHTAVVLRSDSGEASEVVTTRVRLVPLSDDEIAWYIQSGEPDGKAGAYAIQGRAARFIDRIEGSWSNVVGLPIATVHRLLKTGLEPAG